MEIQYYSYLLSLYFIIYCSWFFLGSYSNDICTVGFAPKK